MTDRISPSSRHILIVADDPARAGHLARHLRLGWPHPSGLHLELRDGHDEDTPLAPRLDAMIVDLGGPGYAGDTAWRFRRVLDACHGASPPVLAIAGAHLGPEATAGRADRIDALSVSTPDELPYLATRLAQVLSAAEPGPAWDPEATMATRGAGP